MNCTYYELAMHFISRNLTLVGLINENKPELSSLSLSVLRIVLYTPYYLDFNKKQLLYYIV